MQAVRQLVAVTEDDFPDELKDDFRWLRELAGRSGEQEVDDETATQAANRLLELEGRFSGYLEDLSRSHKD